MSSNYEKMKRSAQALFLKHDIDRAIRMWSLEHDADYLYAEYFGQRLRIDRHTAEVSHAAPPAAGEFQGTDFVHESMALFDLLTHAPERPHASGQWSGVSSLGGIIGAGHDRTLSHEDTAARYAGRTGALAAACERLGGVPQGKSDVGFVIPVFRDFKIWFQFWDADEEFPAGIKYLFDANALQYMHYETLWYVMGSLADRLEFYTGNIKQTKTSHA